MKTILASFGWLLLLLPFISVAGTNTILKSINVEEVEERKVSNFTGINSSGSYNIYVRIGSVQSVRIEGSEDAIKNVETKVDNGILKIQNHKNTSWSWNNWGKVKIYITARSINNLSLNGSGSIEVEDIIKSTNLNTKVSGSGNMKLNIEVSTLNVTLSGSGKIRASGRASTARINVSGSGGFDGKELETQNTDAKVSGSGGIYISADKQLNASLSGSGNIVYSGNARVNQSKSGSGRISRD